MNIRTIAKGLGWFSIALGATELIAGRSLSRRLGLGRTLGVSGPTLIRAYGVRELVAGIGLLAAERKGPWIWARIVGDVFDAATLVSAMRGPRRRAAAAALAVVTPVVALDAISGARLGFSQ